MSLCHECDSIKEYQGNGTQRDYTFSFEYYEASEINVAIYNLTLQKFETLSRTLWDLINPTTVRFVRAPSLRFVIFRCTDISQMRSIFAPGTAIKAADLNENFDQLRFAIDEASCKAEQRGDDFDHGLDLWLNRIDRDRRDPRSGVRGDLVKSFSRLTIDDDSVASTQWIDNRYWDCCEETTYSSDNWSDEIDDAHIPTTRAVEQRISALLKNYNSGISEAPADGREYVRNGQTKQWAPLNVGVTKIIAGSNIGIVSSNGDGTGQVVINATGISGGGGDFPEAPNDGKLYARQSLGWSPFTENIQSDWNVTDASSGAFIKNKPTITNGTLTGVLQGVGISVSNANPAKPEVSVKFGVTANAATTVMPFNVSLLPNLP